MYPLILLYSTAFMAAVRLGFAFDFLGRKVCWIFMFMSTLHGQGELLYRCLLWLWDVNQYVLPTVIETIDLNTTTTTGVDMVCWILWLSIGMLLVLIGHLRCYIEFWWHWHCQHSLLLHSYISGLLTGMGNVELYICQHIPVNHCQWWYAYLS